MIDVFTALFYIFLTIVVFKFGLFISKKFKIVFLNPILIAAIIADTIRKKGTGWNLRDLFSVKA